MQSNYLIISVFAFLAILINPVYAQNILFEDHFEDSQKWDLSYKDYVKFKKGKLVISNESRGLLMVYPKSRKENNVYEKYFVPTRFFSGEMTAKWIMDNEKADLKSGFGVSYHPYSFKIRSDGSYEILYYNKLTKLYETPFSSKGKAVNGINTGVAENKLKVERRDDKFSFYVNDVLIREFVNYDIYKTNDVAFEPFVDGQKVEFYDYVIKSIPVFEKELAEINKANELSLEMAFKSPAQQLIHPFTQYGITMMVNPQWTADKKNVIYSTITLGNEAMQSLKSSFPDFTNAPKSFLVTLAVNSGTIEEKKQQINQLVFEDFSTYHKADNKTISPDEWVSKWSKMVLSAEYFTTTEGKKGELYVWSYPSVEQMGNGTNFSDVYLTSNYKVFYFIPQPDNKYIQCSVEFTGTFPSAKKPLPDDISVFNIFTKTDATKCLAFLKSMIITINGAK